MAALLTQFWRVQTEIIKFYANSDRNARIAVRTITLQVFKVDEPGVEKFVLDRCAVPYFSNLVWFMREECTRLDRVFATASTKATGELESLAAEHLDRLFYLSDVFDTCKEPMGRVVCEQMLFKILLPRAVASVVPSEQEDMLSPMMAMMFLAQTMFVFSSTACLPLVNAIGCALLCQSEPTERGSPYRQALFAAMEEDDDRVILASLAVLLAIFESKIDKEILELAQLVPLRLSEGGAEAEGDGTPAAEKEPLSELIVKVEKGIQGLIEGDLASPPAGGLEDGCPEVVVPEPGLEPEPEPEAAETPAALVAPPAVLEEGATATVDDLIDRLVAVIGRHEDNLRICVLQMAMKLILALRQRETTECLLDPASMEKIRAALTSAAAIVERYLEPGSQWANSMFVFMREELNKLEQRPFNFEHTVSDPVTMLPLDQERNPFIDLNKRLPANEEEKVRRDIRVFLLLRQFVQTLCGTTPTEGEDDPLPMSLNQLFMSPRFKEQEAIDLSTRISTQHWKTSCACGPKREQRYLLITDKSVLIVEPDLYR
jgi:protein CLEC16A